MEKDKNCYRDTIPTVEGGFKIRIFNDKEEAKQALEDENGGKTWEGMSEK